MKTRDILDKTQGNIPGRLLFHERTVQNSNWHPGLLLCLSPCLAVSWVFVNPQVSGRVLNAGILTALLLILLLLILGSTGFARIIRNSLAISCLGQFGMGLAEFVLPRGFDCCAPFWDWHRHAWLADLLMISFCAGGSCLLERDFRNPFRTTPCIAPWSIAAMYLGMYVGALTLLNPLNRVLGDPLGSVWAMVAGMASGHLLFHLCAASFRIFRQRHGNTEDDMRSHSLSRFPLKLY